MDTTSSQPQNMSLGSAGGSSADDPNAAHVSPNDFHASQMVASLLHQAMAGSSAPNVPPPIYGLISPVTAQEPSALDEINIMSNEDVQETISDEVFANFKHIEVIKGCCPHPGDIVEAGSLAALSLPEAVYPLADSIPKAAVESGLLSSLQLLGILYAAQRHQLILPNGNRGGFFIGDAAGVGKGRQIAGMILDNFVRGRPRHVWFSISTDLIVDARRDLTDIGCFLKVIEGCKQLDKETRVFGLPADFKEGVIFSTYATLVSSVQCGGAMNTSRRSRLQQLVDWCGGADFEGCLVFDECHKAKNFNPGKEASSTKVAMAVSTIQKMLPKARVVYCSATGVSDVKNMAYMERLGLWGEGAGFKSFEVFLDTVHRKGLGVAEMLAMEMKSSGMYIARGLSYKQAEFFTVEIPLTKEQKKMYNTAAHVWNELLKSLESALERTYNAANRIWSTYWGAHQRFFKQLCMGIKVDSIVKESEQALESGQCVVIGLQTTGEASLEAEISRSGTDLTGFISLCREILTRFIKQNFPTVVEGKTSDTGPVEDDWCVTAKQMLMSFAQKIPLPNSPLDDIIDKLGGPCNVAEMTGRRGRMVRHTPNDVPRYQQRDGDGSNSEVDTLNVRERNAFMSGEKKVAIISDAASTGISLHADKRCDNQCRRVHITMELPWSADKAVQQLGRSHRSNQTSGPLYKLMTTNLGGERRFASAVARRLESLGALTKGDRRAATGADLAEFNFDTPYGRSALRSMYNAICMKSIPVGIPVASITGGNTDLALFNAAMQECLTHMGLMEGQTISTAAKVKDKDAGDVGKFLNRILGQSVEKQKMMFRYFTLCLDSQIAMAKKEGRFNEGLVDITATSVTMLGEPKVVFKQKNRTNNPTKHVVLNVDRGMPWEQALKRLENHPGDDNGFYVSRRSRIRRFFILATAKETNVHVFKIARPNTGVSYFEEEKKDLLIKYMPISIKEAEEGWQEQYKVSEKQCIHGPRCRGTACTVGVRCYRMDLLCGGIVTMMSLLDLTISKYGAKLQLSKSESTLRVVRVQLDSGERVIGIRYPEMLIPLVDRSIREEQEVALQRKKSMVTESLLQQARLAAANPSASSQQHMADLLQQIHKVDSAVKIDLADSAEAVSSTLIVEPVAPVIPKLVVKASTPPLTIKSFFKPRAGKESMESPQKSNVKKVDETENVTKCASDTEISNDAVGICVKEEVKPVVPDKKPLPSVSSAKKDSNKRLYAGGTSGNPPKRQKQVNIMASFAKHKVVKEDAKEALCPICSKEFKAGTPNQEINKHVDNCLID